ncbi:MAG: PIG-L family deacetylase [Candidatus Hydrogenedentes bacterium]|nr:PIG-L family deacetylase [Candidatus Hydrogenedentota bacterium]
MNTQRRTQALHILFALLCLRAWCAPDLGDVALHQALLDVGTDLRLMCVAAHPDDEDGATLAYYRMKYGIHTVAVFATRGEGGQNEIGPELYNDLGVIRTRETTAATRIQGAELRYLNLPEFGFSKSPDEAFQVWGHEETVRRLVRAIRTEQPDVIISHHGTLKDHGHHQAVGIALREAFGAAADPAKFPEQIAEDLKPWQASRLFLRDWANPPGAKSVLVDIGELEPARGLTYAEVAADALRQHRSQGMAMFAESHLSGRPKTYYTLVAEAPQGAAGSIPAPGGALLEGLRDRVSSKDRALSRVRLDSAGSESKLLKLVKDARARRDESPENHRRWERLNHAAVVGAGLDLSSETSGVECIPGQALPVNVTLRDFGSPSARSAVISVLPEPWFSKSAPSSETVTLTPNKDATATVQTPIPNDEPITLPLAEHLFDPHFLEPQLIATAVADCGGVSLELRAPLRIEVAQSITAEFVEPKYLARLGVDRSVTFGVRVTNHSPGPARGIVLLSVAPALKLETRRIPVEFSAAGGQRIIPITAALAENAPAGDLHLTAMVEGLPYASHAVLRLVDVRVPKTARVGVVQTYDDVFMKTLERFHVPHEALTLKDFTPERLAAFTVIIIDIRAYRMRPDLVSNNETVLDFVKRGGALLVMYQKTFDWKETYAPYPIHVSTNRVTREDAPVQLLAPDNPLFTSPNAITESDWSGWIQERGLYFPDSWDDRYTPLLGCSDPGESIPPGSCLIAKYGAGTYFYTALGWYRQLRELHPGALRVFANMIALGAPHN